MFEMPAAQTDHLTACGTPHASAPPPQWTSDRPTGKNRGEQPWEKWAASARAHRPARRRPATKASLGRDGRGARRGRPRVGAGHAPSCPRQRQDMGRVLGSGTAAAPPCQACWPGQGAPLPTEGREQSLRSARGGARGGRAWVWSSRTAGVQPHRSNDFDGAVQRHVHSLRVWCCAAVWRGDRQGPWVLHGRAAQCREDGPSGVTKVQRRWIVFNRSVCLQSGQQSSTMGADKKAQGFSSLTTVVVGAALGLLVVALRYARSNCAAR